MNKSVLFFGSFQHYSTKVLAALVESEKIDVLGIVTMPPRPSGRYKKLTKTHTHEWAEKKKLSVFAPEKLNSQTLENIGMTIGRIPDFMVTAGYGKLVPASWLTYPKIAPINLHFSLLPRYRGANPAEWAILMGETETGVTMIVMDEGFDTGKIITRKNVMITKDDTRETLYETLYDLAGELAVETLPNLENVDFASEQPREPKTKYARRLMRGNGLIDWELVTKALVGENLAQDERTGIFNHTPGKWPEVLERTIRALYGYPGIWTRVDTKKSKKRMKLLESHVDGNKLVLTKVQIEGQQPATFNQIKSALKTTG